MREEIAMADHSNDDSWSNEIADIAPLKRPPIHTPAAEVKPITPSHQVEPDIDFGVPQPPTVSASIQHLKPLGVGDFSDIDAATTRKLKRGQLPIGGTLDLHGMTQAGALDALEEFIFQQVNRSRKLVLIITGKGSLSQPSILKTNLPTWLNSPTLRPYIIALDHATPPHGGSGAFYVLLRKKAL